MFKVMLVVQPALFRDCLTSSLSKHRGIGVVCAIGSGDQAISAAGRVRPQVAIVDPSVPAGGADLVRGLRGAVQDCTVVLLTNSLGQSDLFDYINAGARGIVKIDCEVDHLVEAIGRVASGDLYVDATSDRQSERNLRRQVQLRSLTQREQEVIRLVAEGLTNLEVSRLLSITENTVKGHLANIFGKLEVYNRVQLTSYAIQQGLIQHSR